MDKLRIKGVGNCGNETTQMVKWSTRYHRTRGVHVTPTVFVNGQEATKVSSGWSADEWGALISPLLEQ